jgi:FixJ family two-component response regulator
MTDHPPIVFIVDDDASVREALKNLIRSVGLHVELFGSATEFLETQRTRFAAPVSRRQRSYSHHYHYRPW